MSYKNSFTDYISYIKNKAINKENNFVYNYSKCYNKGLELKESDPSQAVQIFSQLYKVKKDPDVLYQLQLLQASNPEC